MYDPTKLSKYISHFDVNNLYGWTMSGYGRFNWLKSVDNVDIQSLRIIQQGIFLNLT